MARTDLRLQPRLSTFTPEPFTHLLGLPGVVPGLVLEEGQESGRAGIIREMTPGYGL